MKRKVRLKDGSDVVIRPLRKEDIDRSHAFFQALPPEDRAYLRVDVTKREIVKRRIQTMKSCGVKRLVAVVDDRIVADGALELEAPGWKEHMVELRLIVARPFQRKGLGMLMARELYLLAVKENVEEVIVKMMRPQIGAHRIFKRLGFREKAMLPEYVKDMGGKRQDLIVMRCNLEAMWKELEVYLAESDWQRVR
ncbi:GNAT family N-acetyltransferase [candidate division KSB1 bacterium]|nr:GNAT family N-acetyltransferase [candidate division KSB1 bacterium]